VTRTYCDICGEQLGPIHPAPTLCPPFNHPNRGVPFAICLTLCVWCSDGLLEAYANEDKEKIGSLWMKIADRQGWSIPVETIVDLVCKAIPGP